MVRATSRRRDFGRPLTAARNGCERSICNVGFQIAAVALHRASSACPSNLFVHPLNESIELFLRHAILLQRVIVRVNCDRPKRDDFVTMQNANVLPIGGALEKGGKICPRTCRRQCRHETILRRYGEQLKCISLTCRPALRRHM